MMAAIALANKMARGIWAISDKITGLQGSGAGTGMRKMPTSGPGEGEVYEANDLNGQTDRTDLGRKN